MELDKSLNLSDVDCNAKKNLSFLGDTQLAILKTNSGQSHATHAKASSVAPP